MVLGMMLIFDTSIVIDLDRRQKSIIEKVSNLKVDYPEPPKISFISYFEFIYGLREKHIHNKEKSLAFIENFEVVQTTKNTAHILSILKQKYGGQHFSDLFIAAQAIENGMMLVTSDRDFEKIEEMNKIIM
ncbi:MAG: PIN domain-containing protein [Candidatus Aenigmarchaeota archaeon]|nr:PIN domain-containing protein [Candidatus Aenigmarchaeota archaeon]